MLQLYVKCHHQPKSFNLYCIIDLEPIAMHGLFWGGAVDVGYWCGNDADTKCSGFDKGLPLQHHDLSVWPNRKVNKTQNNLTNIFYFYVINCKMDGICTFYLSDIRVINQPLSCTALSCISTPFDTTSLICSVMYTAFQSQGKQMHHEKEK